MQSLSAFEHHGVELRQHNQTTCSLPGCWQRILWQRPCCCVTLPEPTEVTPERALLCCGARVSCSPHRPCLVPFLAPSQYGKTAFHLTAMSGHVAAMELLLAQGADPTAKDEVRAPLGSFMAGGERREGVRVQHYTRACHERCTGTHEPPAQALHSPRRTQSHETSKVTRDDLEVS